ncbi:MAG: polyhydroxybutyrate depolymerase [Pseudomonadota bacterium]
MGRWFRAFEGVVPLCRWSAWLVTITALLGLFGAGHATACGVETDCVIADRHYRLHLPQGADLSKPLGALFFAHGYRGTAAGTIKNGALKALADRWGLALVALKSSGGDWSIPNAPSHETLPDVDEMVYVDTVIADLGRRIVLDRQKLVMAGFSAGGMMTWEVACRRPAAFAGFVPVAGTFWDPVPRECADPQPTILHIHGETDRIVPLEGRRIGDARQGRLSAAMALMAGRGFDELSAPIAITAGAGGQTLRCRSATAADALFEVCLHPGGHDFRAGYLDYALSVILGQKG